MQALFVAGAHTDVGKTYVAAAVIEAARAAGRTVDAFKPVVSGFDSRDWVASDPGRLLTALGRPLTPESLDDIAPLRFAAPLSPPMAARLEGASLSLADLADPCRRRLAESQAELLLIEGAGGVMSPMAEDGLCLDLMQALGLPAILVGGSYLGAISHTLTALEVLRARGLEVRAVVVSESAGADLPDFGQTLEAVARFGGATTLPAARDGDLGWARALF
jgi:dethiobiotin synthetase